MRPGERHELVDGGRHPVGRPASDLGGPAQALCVVRLGERDIERRPDDCQRVPQLVRGILDEAALGPHSLIEPIEHRVERVGEIAHLVGRAVEVDPPREIGGLDLPRDAGDLADGPYDAAGDSPADGEADRHQQEQRRQRQVANQLERLVADGLFHAQECIGAGLATALDLGEAHVEDPEQLAFDGRRLLLRDGRGHLVQGQVHAQHEDAGRDEQRGGHQHREPEANRPNGRPTRRNGDGLTRRPPRGDSQRPRPSRSAARARLGKLAAQVADGDADRVRERVGLIVPDVLEQALRCQDLARVEHEVPEEGELLGRQVETVVVAVRLVPGRVEHEAAQPDGRPSVDRRASRKGTNTRGELREAERLDQVVVGPVIEAAHPVVEPVPGGEHQDARWRGARQPELAGAKAAADLPTVAIGQAEVQADDVIRSVLETLARLRGIAAVSIA